ncbi:SGNH/GDSL hydrolase family protein [Allostreptomyces psammosilenae]|uniref:Lysophospholipase L1-like esterase n=1 Tax=Allostreptomyces psammosilenae TaxID=1892865 RepID=A0A852ZTJ6_9ACTN|nr:SGNH/GDSL hydrolase family protein [Allostreptomyces psammosilenae]NYI05736.1 lysophospholipase L1-like esterase [Allostreptomyces psammosilenae]
MRTSTPGTSRAAGRWRIRLPRSRSRRVALALCLLLVGVLGVGSVPGYLTFLRGPDNPPAEACADGNTPGRPVVVAAGASMTQGTLGADWVGALRDRPEYRGHEVVNAGVNGSTSADLRQRVDSDIVACRPDAVVVLIGANDVRGDVPPEEYRENLEAIVDRVSARTTARIALMSLPPLGEDLDSELNRRLAGYNAVIEETATGSGADYLPLHERMADLLRQRAGEPTPYAFSFPLAYVAATKHYLLGRSWDEVARSHRLELLVDHLHLSDRGGAIVTDLTAQWLSTGDGASD